MLRQISLILVGLWVLLAAPSVAAQDQGVVAIAQPTPGAIITGVAVINGTATHPAFVRYELAFALDPDPTNTWFTVQDAVNAPVAAGPLGSWDTRALVDGTYALRVRVYTSERNFVEAVVRGLRVQNTQPTATPPATEIIPLTPTPIPAPTVTAVMIAAQPSSASRPTENAPFLPALTPLLSLTQIQVEAAFWQGARLSLIIFGILGLYVGVRALGRRLNKS